MSGTHNADFELVHWGHLVLVSLIFGSAFLWISVALRSFDPTVIAASRVALGALALGFMPSARTRIRRGDFPMLVVAGLSGQAVPALMFAMAEQRISAATSGMSVSAIPVVTAGLAAALARRLPSARRVGGLVLGLTGVGLMTLPDLTSADQSLAGVALLAIAVVGYGIANLIYVPLQQTYGALPVVFWSLVIASASLTPLGLTGITSSRVEPVPLAALAILGVLGTGVVRTLHVSLAGRVGATRATIAAYLIPIVALGLGVVVLDETVHVVQVVGMAVTLGGGYLVSKRQ